MTGTVLIWQSRAEGPAMPAAPTPRLASAMAPINLARIPGAPSADPKTKEEKRFARADKDEDGRITLAELVEPRRKAFAKLDLNQDGKLGFEEWAVKTIDKFDGADADRSKALTPAEYATTAPKVKPKPACACG
ncbi:MAG TPA: EF-hand domain-containing protein [Sphingomicrobium sp.]|nr:EF-hand domain-containing protein [Sphingomicrobium sp.]